ncbi:MAG: mechanosensitive ion channel [Roseitalea porphyridii]|jgi:MscS family membrane protein
MHHAARPLCAALLILILAVAAAAQDGSQRFFQTDALNDGLGPVPVGIDRETPQATVESFLDRAADGDWQGAAHLLDLSGYPVAEQPSAGPELARQLAVIIERKVVIDWTDLPDRPDGLNARAPSEAAMAGEPRRSILLWMVELDDRPVSIRLNRVRPAGGDPVWLFAEASVENLPALAARYGRSQFEAMLPEPLHREVVFDLRLWELFALPLAVLLALGLGFGTYALMSRGLFRKRRDEGGESFMLAVRGPLILLVMTATVNLFTHGLFVFSGRIDALVSPLIAVGYFIVAIWLVINVADTILNRLIDFDQGQLSPVGEGQERKRGLATKIAAARRLLIVILVVAGGGLLLREANLAHNLGISLLASAGVLTLILAFAARSILANILSSMQIALNQSAKIGDKLLWGDYICTVERIHFTFVQLRDWSGRRIVVPVSDFVEESFENWTMVDSEIIRRVDLRLAHDAPIDPLRRAYDDILDTMSDRLGDLDNRGVYVTGHDVFGQSVMFLVPCDDPNAAWLLECEVREKLLAAAAEIEARGEEVFPEAKPAEAA